MSLFSDLLRLQGGQTSTEDFFTEIVAYLLRETDDLLFAWIDHLGYLDTSDYIDFKVSTQISYDEGRPDIVIELKTEDSDDIVFIESKLASQEGRRQLRRYARELAKINHARNRILLYITREFEPKVTGDILQDIPDGSVVFKQRRWHEFYQFLKSLPADSLIDATSEFMEEKRMAQTNLISPTDVLAMNNLPQVLSLMNETLFGEVSHRFEEAVGSVSTKRRTNQELRMDRYVIGGYLSEGFWCGLGYWFTDSEYPQIGMMLVMRPQAKDTEAILDAFHQLSQRDDWKGYRLNRPRKRPNIKKLCSLNEFLVGPDHLKEIRDYFLGLLDELVKIQGEFPQVPWGLKDRESETEDEEE